MAEWLRRWTWNPMGFPHAGWNPAYSVYLLLWLLLNCQGLCYRIRKANIWTGWGNISPFRLCSVKCQNLLSHIWCLLGQFIHVTSYSGISICNSKVNTLLFYSGAIPFSSRTRRKAVMAERLRRWTWNPMGFPRGGSNPAHSDLKLLFSLQVLIAFL